ncbi:conserved hypothetical protein [Pediculus humanus corporis]|uniref:BHLH domain-containing protein n=1 Tax=Pediculus humanus subsp. corporis TaxID=121224 RepID=E0VXK7_PEDHC|nr:uncharacterized protein Phum_PHUM501890 [Pediculus humanus corporis]EEB18113.1 conserved hypothetical protein [Pediculus humanus corporis]
MTLLANNVVGMKPKIGIINDDARITEPVYIKQNIKMAINKNMIATTKKLNSESSVDNYARGTVLVNNVNNAAHRNPMSGNNNNNNNVRTIVSNSKNINIPNNELLRCKRKIHFISGQSYPGAQPASVARRNARERNRVKQVNNGFATLRSHIPASVAAALTSEKSSPRNSSASKKLSKVETLKMAVEYIRSLQQMLEDHNNKISVDSSSALDKINNRTCSSPTPSYSSDHSSVHLGSAPSAHLISSLSRLTTHVGPNDPFKNQMTSPIPRSASPVIVVNASKCLTPPRNISPLSNPPPSSTYPIVQDSSSPSNQSNYSVNMEFQKGSPEGYENYDSVSPEDEELLDVISWWQQSH